MLSLLALFCTAFAWAGSPLAPEYAQLPEAARAKLVDAEADLQKTVVGRRLLAETEQVARLACVGGLDGPPVVLRRLPKPTLVFDAERLPPKTALWEFELAFARELAKAAMDIPLELADAEMAALQEELTFAVDKAGKDPAFSSWLRNAVNAAQRRLKDLPEEDRLLYPPPTPAGEIARAGYYAALFAKSPPQFYWAVERDTPWGPGMVRLAEMEDFLARLGSQLDKARVVSGTPYVQIGGRLYPARLFEAARPLLLIGGVEHAREALGQYDGIPALDLRQRLTAWLARSS